MRARISLITLGVDDLERSLKFYRDGLGLPTTGIVGTEFEHGAVVFIDLQAGLKLALWPRKEIAYDAGIKPAGTSGNRIHHRSQCADAAGGGRGHGTGRKSRSEDHKTAGRHFLG